MSRMRSHRTSTWDSPGAGRQRDGRTLLRQRQVMLPDNQPEGAP
jgi:hypothetical protein